MSEVKTLNFKRAADNKNWYVARIQINNTDYTINMLRFDEPSCYGIADGRISKLFIFSKIEDSLWYDRGWDRTTPKYNTKEIQEIYEKIVNEYN